MTVDADEPVITRTLKGVETSRTVTTMDSADLTPNGDGTYTTPDGQRVTVRGNEMTVTYDSNGVPMRFEMTITEQYPNISRLRTSAELSAQQTAAADGDIGAVHDGAPSQDYDGGHAGGHQFFPDLGRNNMFPQASRFNQVGYRNLETEMASWANSGARVDAEVDLTVTRNGGRQPIQSYRVDGDVVQQVPDRVTVRLRYTDPNSGIISRVRLRFRNLEGQTYQARLPDAAQRAQLARSGGGS